MKTVTIGDVHGTEIWKSVDPEKFDKIIFVGDYVDSFTAPDKLILNNLLDIIQFKKDYPDKVVLLLGNHDTDNYMVFKAYCSGYRSEMYEDLHTIFNEKRELFQIAYSIDNYLWTHAGVHTGWYNQQFLPTVDDMTIWNFTIEEQLNEEFIKKNDAIFHVGRLRGGHHDVGGPLWADRRMTQQKPLEGFHQIVGHTRVEKILHFDINDETSITYVDCLEHGIPEFYEKEL